MKPKEFLRVAGGIFCIGIGAIILVQQAGKLAQMVGGIALIAIGVGLLVTE